MQQQNNSNKNRKTEKSIIYTRPIKTYDTKTISIYYYGNLYDYDRPFSELVNNLAGYKNWKQ
jgi:hypothetical protein